MKVALIQTPVPKIQDDRLEVNLGLLYVATYLNKNGFDVEFCDLSSMEDWDLPKADIYGFSTYTTTYYETVKIAATCKSLNKKAKLVAGGPHASALPNYVRENFNSVVVGEGETAMYDVCSGNKSGIVFGSPIPDLDDIPYPDYSLVDIDTYNRIVDGKQSLTLITSRGCPYNCKYCNSVVMGDSKNVRYRSPENVVGEIMELKDKYGVDNFRFGDDMFIRPKMKRLTDAIAKTDITYRCFARVDRCSHKVADYLAESGCKHISFGIESGDNKILRLMNKKQSVRDIRLGIINAKNSGMKVRVYLIVGYPGETWNSVWRTIDLMKEVKPDEFTAYPLVIYPGTDLYINPEEYGINYIDDNFDNYYQVKKGKETSYMFRTDHLDENTIREMRQTVIDELSGEILWSGESVDYK